LRMKVPVVFILSVAIASCSCGSKKIANLTSLKSDSIQTTKTASTDTSQSVAGKKDSLNKNTYRFVVLFYSIGEGTEGEQIRRFEQFISEYGKKKNKKIVQ